MRSDIEKLNQIAEAYRLDNAKQAGVVLIWCCQAYAWKDQLRDPQHERPGAIAVDNVGSVFVATGGNDYDGARQWEII